MTSGNQELSEVQKNDLRMRLLGRGKMLGHEMTEAPKRHPMTEHVRGLFPKLSVVQLRMAMGLRLPPLLVIEYTSSLVPCTCYKVEAHL